MANEQNLIHYTSDQDPVMARINGKKGGIASGEAKRRRKAIREQMELLLSLPLKNNTVRKQLSELGIEEDEMTNQMAMIIKMYQTALKGGNNSVSAFNSIRDTIGEKPIDVQQVVETPIINDDIPNE